MTCIFGVTFLLLFTASGQGVIVARNVLRLATSGASINDKRGYAGWRTQAVAMIALVLSYTLHSFWRKGGILVLEMLTLVKLATLWAIILIGALALGASAFLNTSTSRRISV